MPGKSIAEKSADRIAAAQRKFAEAAKRKAEADKLQEKPASAASRKDGQMSKALSHMT